MSGRPSSNPETAPGRPGAPGGPRGANIGRRGGSLISTDLRNRIRLVAIPIALALGRLGLTPNALTIVGFLGTCAAAVAAAAGAWTLAGVLVLVFGIFDLFDGALARATGRTSAFGAFLDSTLDRLGENVVYAGIAVGCGIAFFPAGVTAAVLALAFASVVTYTRAKAESIGLHGEVGIAPRPERLVVLAIGLVLCGATGGVEPSGLLPLPPHEATGNQFLVLALAIIAGTCAITIVQRIVHVHRQVSHQ